MNASYKSLIDSKKKINEIQEVLIDLGKKRKCTISKNETNDNTVNKQFQLMKTAEKIIRESCSGCLTEKEIAYKLGIYPSDFVRIFRKIKGMTPKTFIDEQLKTKVMQVLSTKCKFGYKLAYEFGFSSEQAFYRWVKRVFGIPFKVLYQHQQKNSINQIT